MKQHLTERTVKAMVPDADRDLLVYDDEVIGFGLYVCLVDRGVRQAEAELADEIGLIEVRAGPPSSGHSAPSSAASRSRRR
jgi:hypothetical protein